MSTVVIIGAGYAGKRLIPRLVAAGERVVATTTSKDEHALLERLGAEPRVLDLAYPTYDAGIFAGAHAVVHLAPPVRSLSASDIARRLSAVLPSSLEAYVYGSTTGVFGEQPDPEAWVDEETPLGVLSARAHLRLDYETALELVGLPLRVLRIAGIYGPERTLKDAIARGEWVNLANGRNASRIHVDDLARLLEAALAPAAPALFVACDEEPAPTRDVAKFTADLLGLPEPRTVDEAEAKRLLSPLAYEMRIGGHRCRSLHRERLIGPLLFPTYREGLSDCFLRAMDRGP